MKICGTNRHCQLTVNSNNTNIDHTPIITPVINSNLNPLSLLSFSVYNEHSVWITRDGKVHAIGDNRYGQIVTNIPKESINTDTIFSIQDKDGNSWLSISAVCGESYTLYLVSSPNKKGPPRLAYSYRNQNTPHPLFLNTDEHYPIAIFGGRQTAAAIDIDGSVLIIKKTFFQSSSTIADFISLPRGEKAVQVACCDESVIVLSNNGRVFEASLTNNKRLFFSGIVDFIGVKIVGISGTHNHFLAVSSEGFVFGRGSNSQGRLCFESNIQKVDKFTVISSLRKYRIKSAFAGYSHSLFQTFEGQVVAGGDNYNGNLLLDRQPNEEDFFSPVETVVRKGATLCITGWNLSVVFVDCEPPPNMPNSFITKPKEAITWPQLNYVDEAQNSKNEIEEVTSNQNQQQQALSQNPIEHNISQNPIEHNISQNPIELNVNQNPIELNISQNPIEHNISQNPIELNVSQNSTEINGVLNSIENKSQSDFGQSRTDDKMRIIELERKLNEKNSKIRKLEKELNKSKLKIDLLQSQKQSSKSTSSSSSVRVYDSKQFSNFRTTREVHSSDDDYEEEEEEEFENGVKVLEVVSDESFIMRRMKVNVWNNEKQQQVVNLIETIQMGNHPNIQKMLGFYVDNEELTASFLYEYCQIDLSQMIRNNSPSKVDLVSSVYQIAEALKYAHFVGVCHGNLTPQTVMVDDKGIIKIGGFCLSLFIKNNSNEFDAPEIGNEIDEKADVYSFGVLLLYILNGGKKIDLGNKKKPVFPRAFSDYSKELIKKCCNVNPKKRPNFNVICKELELNEFNLISLSKSEIQKIKMFVENHKKLIPY